MDDAKRSALTKGLEVLESLLQYSRLSDIVADTGLPAGTVHRILGELVSGGWAVQDDARQYFPGRRLYSVAGRLLEDDHLVVVALPFLERLRREMGFAVHMGLHIGPTITYVAKLEGLHPDGLETHVGQRVLMASTAIGQAVLASRSADFAREVFARETDDAPPGGSEVWLAELGRSRARGWAVDVGGTFPGWRSVAAPVYSPSGLAFGAVSIAAPVGELPGGQVSRVARAVQDAALDISRAFGAPA